MCMCMCMCMCMGMCICYACMRQVAAIVGSNASLRSLDLSGNSLSEEAGRLLREGLHSNTTLSSMDLRLNQITVDTVAAVEDACKKNKLEAHRARREYLEAVRLQETGSS